MDDNRAVFSKPPGTPEAAGEQERKFLVSELLPFIPPAISAQSGIPMEMEVSIPMPDSGSGEVKLSTIYQACPDLFAAEITPLNDSEVTLPVKLGGFFSEDQFSASPFTPGKAFGKSEEPPNDGSDEASADNPFWSPVGESDSGDPDRSYSEPPAEKEEPPQQNHPESNTPQAFGGFDEPLSTPTESSRPTEPSEPSEPSEPDPVKSGFSGMSSGGEEKMFTLFSNSEESADPDDEEEAEFEPATNWGSMFQSPVREEPENEEPPEMEQAAPESEGFSAPPEGFDEPAPEEKEDGSDVPRGFEMPETEFAPPEDSDSPSSEVKVDEPVESAGFEMPESEPVSEPVKDEAPAKVEAEEPEEEPEPAPAAKSEPAQAEPVKEKEVEKPNPTLEWTTTPAAPATPRANEEPVVSRLQNNDEDDLSDVELRAIFSTSDRFTLAKLARKIVALPGIAACALSGSGKVVQATKSEQNQLGSDAHDMVDAVRNIAKLTGMDSAKSFTMKTEFGVVSLFLEDDCCLSVNHEEGEFGPGVREKLIVIARSMHKLKD